MKKLTDTLAPTVVDTVATYKCFCGAKLVVGFEGSELCMAHDVPACERFMRDEPPDQFLEALRKHCAGFVESNPP